MNHTNFARYWWVERINGKNGPLIELKYDWGDAHAAKTLGELNVLIEELKDLEIDEVMSSPELISQIWHMSRWIMGQQFRWEKRGYSSELLNGLKSIRQGVDAELFRIFNSRFLPDWPAMEP